MGDKVRKWQQLVTCAIDHILGLSSFDSLLAGDRWLAACTKWTLPNPKQRLVAAVPYQHTPKDHLSQVLLSPRFCARAHESRPRSRRRNNAYNQTVHSSQHPLQRSGAATTKGRARKSLTKLGHLNGTSGAEQKTSPELTL